MATLNPFDLLDDDAEDPSLLLIAAAAAAAAAAEQQKQKQASTPANKKGNAKSAAKLPTKPVSPSQAVKEAKYDGQRVGGQGGQRGGVRGRRGDGENTFGGNNGFSGYGGPRGYRASEDGDSGKPYERRGGYAGPRGDFRGDRRNDLSNGDIRGGRRDDFSNGDAGDGERPRRTYERRSGTGYGNDFKREGAGRGNWGTSTDEIAPVSEFKDNEEPVNEAEKVTDVEKQAEQTDTGDAVKDSSVADPPEKEPKEPEPKLMTLEEYEKLLGEKRQALLALKSEERKVNLDKEFESMQLLSNKKNADEVFVKLGSEKEVSEKEKRKDVGEKTKKTQTINEFLKGERYRGGRGRGRTGGRGSGNISTGGPGEFIVDAAQFPSLGGK